MGDFLPGAWKPCIGMNKDGKCRAGKNHLSHKKSWGKWYGQVPVRKMPPRPKPNKPQKKRWWQ